LRDARKYFGLVVPFGFVAWRLWSLGRTSFETLAHQPTGAAGAAFKLSPMEAMWGAVLALIFVVVVLERQQPASIGLRWPTWPDLVWVPVVLIASLLLESLWTLFLLALRGDSISALAHAPVSPLPVRVRLVMLATEPLFEETVFRGYLVERIQSLTGSVSAAVCVSALASSLMHGGWALGFAIVPLGLGEAVLYAWRRNLPACLLLHVLWMLLPMLGVA
jgi:membrane protease YdiL (CAAX protease family)